MGSGHEAPPDRPRSWALIDTEAYRRNIARVRRLCPGGNLLAVLKADAYGHGATILAPEAVKASVSHLGVGDSHEGLQLRRAGISGAIVVLGDLVPEEIPRVVAEGLCVVLHSEGRLIQVEAEAERQGRRVPVHLKVDTGMGRLGMAPSRVSHLAARAKASPHLLYDGLMSHLAGGGPPGREQNLLQARRFEKICAELRQHDLLPPWVHLRASPGLLDPMPAPAAETLCRAGDLILGFPPGGGRSAFEAVMRLETQLVFLKDVPEGTSIGYGHSVTTRRPTRLGVIPFGYHDGMRRELAKSGGEVLIRGRRVPLIGAVSMDYATLDISDVPGARVGDRVTLIGSQGEERIRVEQVARWAGTIPHDILCGLGPRVVRMAPVSSDGGEAPC